MKPSQPQDLKYQQSVIQKIKDAKYKIEQVDNQTTIFTGAISNNLKYIIAGGPDKILIIWRYQTNVLMKSLKFDYQIMSCNFTDDSQLLYVGIEKRLVQLSVKANFKTICILNLHKRQIASIYCISKTIILTSSFDNTIIKTDVNLRQQLFKIHSHNYYVYSGIDYNRNLNIIAGSDDRSIKLWNGYDGSLIIKKPNAHRNDSYVKQVLFIINNNQLASLTLTIEQNLIIIWNINYPKKQLEQVQQLEICGYNISLVLQQQYMLITGKDFFQVYTIGGDFVRQFDHQFNDFGIFYSIQHQSLIATLIDLNNKSKVFIIILSNNIVFFCSNFLVSDYQFGTSTSFQRAIITANRQFLNKMNPSQIILNSKSSKGHQNKPKTSIII
ncbi:hypothetical protein pb186bvf_015971 [Paramecium bursaria]